MLCRYRQRLSSLSSSAASRALEGTTDEKTLVGWDHPCLLLPLEQLGGIGKPRLNSYSAEDVERLLRRLSEVAWRTDSFAGMVRLWNEASRRGLNVHYGKTDLLLDIFAGRLPVFTEAKHPTLADLHILLEDLRRCRARLFVRQNLGKGRYLPWSALAKRLEPLFGSTLRIGQWELHRLAKNGIHFGLVVIDEASQMTPENAIGAISRAAQVMVVGDTKQLPPTNFFSKLISDDDVEEDLQVDAESILDMANATFSPVRQLRWHYRSRHSGLIRFSNKWMYGDNLTIFPSASEVDPEMGVRLVQTNGVYAGRR